MPRSSKGSPKVHRYESLQQEDGTSDDREELARTFPHCPRAEVEWPERNASLISQLSFWWFNPMIKLGNRTHVQVDDLWALSARDSSAANVARFRPMWRAECALAHQDGRPPNILRPIVRFVLPMILQVAVLQLFSVGFQFLRPVLLQQILMLVEGDEAALLPVKDGWMLAVALFLTTVADFVCVQHLNWLQYKQQVRVRAAVIGLLYEQTVLLSDGTKQSYSSGKITNMMDTDQSTLQTYTTQLNRLWQVPLTFILALSMILKLLGWAGALGVICMLPMTLATRWNVMALRTWKKRRVIKADARLKTLTEIMQGIRIIKFMNWEESFKERIDALRTDEIYATKMAAIVRSLYSAFADFQPILIMIVSLGTFSMVFGHTLTASIAFPTLNFLNILRNPLVQFPDALNWVLVEGKIAGDRISAFLSEGQTVEYREMRPSEPSAEGSGQPRSSEGSSHVAIEIVSATFRFDEPPPSILWAPEDVGSKFGSRDSLKQIQKRRDEMYAARQARASSRPPPVLQDINLSVRQGDLVCLIGRVGAGKTALLHSILGELVKVEGRVTISGSLSYASQSAFILNSTVKENILFGSPYDEQRYCDVVRGCALAVDLKTLPDGDATEIGERGVNLSGGQRQRLGLARALYRTADTYLLDDPLSAVDAHVGAHIMNFILEFVRRERRTIVMSCHQLHFLSNADLIVTLADSKICEVGTFETLMADGNEFRSLMETHSAADSPATTPRGADSADGAAEVNLADTSDAELLVALQGAGKSGSLMSLEDRKTGKVARKTYAFFARQFACGQLVPLALLFLAAQAVRFAMDYWMSRWAIDDQTVIPVQNPTNTTTWFVTGYAFLGVCTFLFSGARYLWLQLIGLGASRKMHNLMLTNLLHAPCSFFDTTPVGRIVNRFSGDVNCLDFTVPVYFHSVTMLALQLLTSLGVVSVMLPGFILWVVPMAWANNWLTTKYRNCAREVKRLSSNLRSPLFQHFNESINGLTTVRAFDALPAFTAKSGQAVDDCSRAQMCQQASPRWLGMRISSLSSVSIFITSFGVLWSPDRLDPGLVGVVLTYTEMVSSSLQSFLQNMTELEIQMNSVERVRFFSEQVSQEAPYVLDNGGPAVRGGRGAPSWPSAGVVRFRNVSARYRPELPRVLQDLTIDVGAAQKIGVCGRTGSGKSTLMLLLFRILELDEGSIEIDGIDISTLGLAQLRKAVAMLPQDPILFAGTVRENLDPFGEHNDVQLYAALEQAQLMHTFKRQNQDLETNVGEGGGTLSVGQRQLLCFARAVLRNSKLLVMDECTANVDVETDALLQSMVRQTFAHCTIFTIAHRLATVIDYDRIAVLDNGRLVEFGQPAELLSDPTGQLTALVEQTGPTMASHLRNAAVAAARGASDSDRS